MTLDALDPGVDWSFPNVPRDADGWLDEQRMPTGLVKQRDRDGNVHLIDVEPTVRDRHGNLVKISAVVPRRPREV